MNTKQEMFKAGVELAERFCQANGITMPTVVELLPGDDRRYYLGTCAYYRPTTIHIMVPKCAQRGMAGRALDLARYLLSECCQRSCTVQTPMESHYLENEGLIVSR